VRELHRSAVSKELKQCAAIQVEGFDDPPLGILDGAIDQIRRQVDELGGQIRDQLLEFQPLFELRAKRVVCLRHRANDTQIESFRRTRSTISGN
jgi:hypothetical protein